MTTTHWFEFLLGLCSSSFIVGILIEHSIKKNNRVLRLQNIASIIHATDPTEPHWGPYKFQAGDKVYIKGFPETIYIFRFYSHFNNTYIFVSLPLSEDIVICKEQDLELYKSSKIKQKLNIPNWM